MNDRRYARFYYPEFIRDYPDVYGDDAAFAAWMRLLVTAEQMWPMTPELPRSVKPRPLAKLVERGLVTLDGVTFHVKGLDAERARRSNAGRIGAAVRWDTDGSATAMRTHSEPDAVGVPSMRAGASSRLGISSPETDPARANDPWEDAEGEAVTWLARHGCDIPPHSGYYRHLVTMVEAHGITAVVGMFDRLADAGMKNGDVKGYVFGARDALDSKTRPSLVDIAKTERSEDVRAATKRAVENTRRYIAELKGADA